MSKRRIINLLAIVLTMIGTLTEIACNHVVGGIESASGNKTTGSRVFGEYLVTLSDGKDIVVLAQLYKQLGVKSIMDLGSNLYLLTLEVDPGPGKMEEIGLQDIRIKAVQPNFRYEAVGPNKNKPQ